MTTMSVTDVLARANAAMVGPHHDVTGAVAELLAGVTTVLSADAAAVLVLSDSALEVLAATSHSSLDLEIYQAEVDEGPCLEALHTGGSISACGADEIRERWPVAGPFMVASGYTAVLATPMRWHDETFGALNVFWAAESDFEERLSECARAPPAGRLRRPRALRPSRGRGPGPGRRARHGARPSRDVGDHLLPTTDLPP